MKMYLRDGHVYTTWGDPLRDDGLVVSRHDLASEISYINAHRIAYVGVFTGDPRVIVDRAYREARLQMLQGAEDREPADYLTDISPLRDCPQLTQLSLSGDVVNSDVLAALPNLRCLSLDNTLGKHSVNLSPLSLHMLYIQKPGRNVRGYEQIESLRKLVIWNYQPKSRDLSGLSKLIHLEHLCLIQPRISSLDGVEQLPSLARLEVSYARILADASALQRCMRPVEAVMDHVPNLICD